MDRKIASLALVAVAFGIGIFAADNAVVSEGASGTLSGRITTACLVMLSGVSVYLWYRHLLSQAKRKWTGNLEMVDGEFSPRGVALTGVDKGTPVLVRIDSEPRDEEEAGIQASRAESSRFTYSVTMAFPLSGEIDWRIVPEAEANGTEDSTTWKVETADADLRRQFEQVRVPELLADCDESARLVCNAKAGEVTLEYPAPDANYCPDPDAFQKELELLRKAVGVWSHTAHSVIAA